MKVLWLTNSPSNFKSNSNIYNGEGWISSLEEFLVSNRNIKLAVSFLMDNQPWKIEQKGVLYYPLKKNCGNWFEIKFKNIVRVDETRRYLSAASRVIEDFKPDIIEVFGSENIWGLIAKTVNLPVVLHVQGIVMPINNACLPPFVSWKKYLFNDLNPISILHRYREKMQWARLQSIEGRIFSSVDYYIGRTTFDKRITSLYNPSRHYFHVDEILRPVFYIPGERVSPPRLTIITTISSPLYKGFDLVLKTAKLLKTQCEFDFVWKCYGNIRPHVVEKMVSIKHNEVNVELCGVATAEQLKDALLNSTIYVHTSYIDNSPNSICEAQILGIPVIATYVGGIPSLIEDKVTGYLVPANDPFQMALLIKSLFADKDLINKIGNEAKKVAKLRHDRNQIINDLLHSYKVIVELYKNK